MSKCFDGMPHPNNSVCCPLTMLACHARLRPTMCVVQGPRLHARPDVIRLYVMSKVHDIQLRLMLSDCVYCPRSIISCNAQLRPCVCSIWAMMVSTPDVVRQCMLSKGKDNILCLTSSDCVSCQRAMTKFNARFV